MHGSCHLCSRPLPAPYGSESTVTCNYCGAESPLGGCEPGTAPCETCGKVLPIGKPNCPDCHAPVGADVPVEVRVLRFRSRLLGGVWFVRSVVGLAMLLPMLVGAGFDESAARRLDVFLEFGLTAGLLAAGLMTAAGSVWGVAIGLGLTALRLVASVPLWVRAYLVDPSQSFFAAIALLIEAILLLLAIDVLIRRLRE